MDLNARKHLPLFPIGIVQKLTGLTPRQVRYYEQHELVQPARSEGNQRLFSFVDVERLLYIRSLLDQGLNMAGVKMQLQKEDKESKQQRPTEPTDEDLFQWMKRERSSRGTASEFQGDLSRFYRKKH
jgi:MerR family glutamine synthetase transcriptional repressor